MKPLTKYCAIYTRKSSEEGLDQDFNSLDAQRESCEAYIVSQKSEGWMTVKDRYDDGGYSGGNMERPALKRLMEDIKAGKVHTVVVYKIDRLTRSLMDFSKLVEVFDQFGVTFVSITQSFNTTTSMGRLTLNVLLSFAQFEREVTGERIRDKVAASKKKGMWMGGNPPLGYDLDNKQLYTNPEEAKTVQYIFQRYLELGCVFRLKQDLEVNNIKSKARVSVKGNHTGGVHFHRGAIYHILKNPIFIGKIRHKDQNYDGLHEPIISDDLWDKVQTQLMGQGVTGRSAKNTKSEGNILKGKLFDVEGNIYTPTYSIRAGKRYCYYISQNLIQYRHHPKGILGRLPAYSLEQTVEINLRQSISSILSLDLEKNQNLLNHLHNNCDNLGTLQLVKAIKKITVDQGKLDIYVDTEILIKIIETELKVLISTDIDKIVAIAAPFFVKRARNGTSLVPIQKNTDRIDPFDLPPTELNKLIRGIAWREEHFSGMSISQIARREDLSDAYIGRLIHNSLIVS